MSQETSEWLNTNVLVGMTSKRGNAWHYREEFNHALYFNADGTPKGHYTSNHYELGIPVEDVVERLFSFEFIEAPAYFAVPCEMDEMQALDDKGLPIKFVKSTEGRKGMLTSDTLEDLGSFKDGYAGHDYKEWLLDGVANLLDSELVIGSAALLQNRAVAFVQVEMPETVTTPEGFAFRPFIGAATSFNGTVATTFKKGATAWVCDNTMAAGLSEAGEKLKFKHTKNSALKLMNARDALNIVHSMADDFSAEVAALTQISVTNNQFNKIVEHLYPLGDEPTKNKITQTMNTRHTIEGLYKHDDRCAPWVGTGLGVWQAFNTYMHHERPQRNRVGSVKSSAERNFEGVVSGAYAKADAEVLSTMQLVCA
jgi:phage/plasmid-like protein (TIGR03299 family)